MEVRAFPMDIRALEDDGRITAYASTFGNVYDVGWGEKEIMEKGAFAKTLKERTGRPILWQHNPAQPIGVELNASEDDKGLLVEVQLNLDVQLAREVRSLALKSSEVSRARGRRAFHSKKHGCQHQTPARGKRIARRMGRRSG